jgi:histidyl-tRNA synthetase
MARFQTLPGFRDFYPEDLAIRNHLFRGWRRAAHAYGFAEYDASILEPLDLYKAKSGDEIETQLFAFTDKGGREVALRPEMTPTVCRLIGERGHTLKRPVRWFSIGEFYRYERMQKGRGRSFFQLNADIFGEPGIEAETELIALLIQCLCSFGLTSDDFYIRLSDRNIWYYYLENQGVDPVRINALLNAVDRYEKYGDDAFNNYVKNFGPLNDDLRTKILCFLNIKNLAALETVLGEVAGDKLKNRLKDWRHLLQNLEQMGLANFVQVDLGVVRGLAYYTGFVFEAFDRKGDLRALAGGGRYDNLIEKLGYNKMPAVGFAMGDMTISLLLEQRKLMPTFGPAADIYLVIGSAAERAVAFGDLFPLRAAGYRVEYSLKELSFGKQFKAAAESGAKLAIIYGGDELARGVVKVRDLIDRSEHEVIQSGVLDAVRDYFTIKGSV